MTPAGPLLALLATLAAPGATARGVRLDVPIVRQAPERCGPAALRMVFGYYRADPAACAATDSAYDPVLRGALVTTLAERARRSGFDARVASGNADSLVAWLRAGIPPIVLITSGFGPITRAHYAVVTGWDPVPDAFRVNDGTARSRVLSRRALERRRTPYDGRALLVTPGGRP